MPFLDLNDELASLGYANAVSIREILAAGSFRIFGTEPSEDRKRYKREWMKDRYAETAGKRRAYRRHPPGTPSYMKGDLQKTAERARRYAKDRRARESMKKAALKRSRDERFAMFLDRLVEAEFVAQAKIICIGRAVYDPNYRPDYRGLYDGEDVHELAARTDFFVWLAHPLRAFDAPDIAAFFDLPCDVIEKALENRPSADKGSRSV